ncbi:hypothetical protein PSAB6_340103 [Paraburkholderia sabiae]|nr:hypothetical protein PSAB6_340103 [Paraburkholderia sabiae]
MAESSLRFAKTCSPKTTCRWNERVAGVVLSGTSTTDDSAISLGRALHWVTPDCVGRETLPTCFSPAKTPNDLIGCEESRFDVCV